MHSYTIIIILCERDTIPVLQVTHMIVYSTFMQSLYYYRIGRYTIVLLNENIT